jgi:GNAT superfamily N-acetyltransferase
VVEGYRISGQFDELDLNAVYRFISTSYWAQEIPKARLEKALANSLCFGVFTQQNEQVGFARMITDYATFAYLADVYIEPQHRGIGLSKWLMSEIHSHPELQHLRRMLLATRDAHGLYQQYGYQPLSHPNTFMEIWRPDIYKKPN